MAKSKLTGGIITVAAINIVLALLFLASGAMSAMVDITLLRQLMAGSVVDIPPAPKELVVFARLQGMETFIEGMLLLSGGIGLLLLANWARIATMAFAGLAIVASVASLVIDVLYVGPLSAPWRMQIAEMLPGTGGDVALAPGLDVLVKQCSGFPFLCYSVFLLVMLNHPPIKEAFGAALAGAAPRADDFEEL